MTDPVLSASIFDMDGLLIDSEPLWQRAEVTVLGALGVPLAASAARSTKGMFVGEVTRYWHERFPWTGPSTDEVAEQVVDEVMALVVAEGALLPGVHLAIDGARRRGLALALASSSAYRLIRLVLDHFDLVGEFAVVHSAEEEQYGKPHPGVFLTAAARLAVAPACCVVWEDAPAGVLAAKAARMACVAVPDDTDRRRPEIALADAVLSSLEEVGEPLWLRLEERRRRLPSGRLNAAG